MKPIQERMTKCMKVQPITTPATPLQRIAQRVTTQGITVKVVKRGETNVSIEEIMLHFKQLEQEAEQKAVSSDHDNYRYMNKGLALGIRAAYEYLAFVAKQEEVMVCGLADEVGQSSH